MERRTTPQAQPRPARFALVDAVLDRLPSDGLLQIAVITTVVAAVLPWVGLPAAWTQSLTTGILPAVLAIIAVLALREDRERVSSRFEQRFWQDLEVAALFFAAAAMIFATSTLIQSPLPDLLGRMLLLVGYGLLLLASEMQPHREEMWRSEQLERRLSLMTVIALGVGLFGYFAFTPSTIQGKLQPAGTPIAFLFTILSALIAIRFISLGLRIDHVQWRAVYRTLSGSALLLVAHHALRTVDTASESGRYLPLQTVLWIGAPAALILAVRLRHHPFPTDWKPRAPDTEPTADPVEESRLGLEFRTLILALAVPVMHFLGYRIGLFATAYEDVREIWMLFWAATLGGLAFTQQHLSGGRLLAILNEQRRIQKTLAAGERRLQMISERKQADEALYYSREKYAKAFRSCPYALTIVTRRDGRHLEANEQYLNMLGLKSEDLYTLRFPDLISEDDGTRWRRLDRQMKRKGNIRHFEIPLRDQQGKERRIELSADQLQVDDEDCYVAICRDLTREEERTHALGLQNRLFELCEAPLVVVDAAGILLQANSAGRGLLQRIYPTELGKPVFGAFFDRSPELTAANLATLEQRNWMGRLPVRHNNQELSVFNCWWIPLRNDNRSRRDRLIMIFEDS